MRRVRWGSLAFSGAMACAGAVSAQTLASAPPVGPAGPAKEVSLYSPTTRPQAAPLYEPASDPAPATPETASAAGCARIARRAAVLEKERKAELRGLAGRQYGVAREVRDSQAEELRSAEESSTVDPDVLRDNHRFENRLLRQTHLQERAELEARYAERRGLLAERAAEACPVPPPAGQLARAPGQGR